MRRIPSLFSRPLLEGLTFFLLSVFSVLGQEVVLDQDFDGAPVDTEGRFGVANSEGGTDQQGRWGNFGSDGTSPHLQEANSQKDVAVELFRGNGDGKQVLLGVFTPIRQARRIYVEFFLMVADQGGASISLSNVNDPAMGVLLQTLTPEIRGWNGEAKSWDKLSGRFPTGEWVKVKMVCDVVAGNYQLQVLGSEGREIVAATLPFDKSLLDEQGLGTLIVSPQFDGPIYFDTVSVRIDP